MFVTWKWIKVLVMESTTNGTSIIENKHVNHLYIVDVLEMVIGKCFEIINSKYSLMTFIFLNDNGLGYVIFSIILDF